ncbi:hypothetical protein BZL30_0456 [Mycobacterium kansasii]|uniref:Uncharacterized protein n=1 Tax=Mycobacterium kansasii TaxID=1768 RepID=A0A1V3XUT8_MYCKA|nr:hypothetical protein BZL30_0456 [Mycobacterium kansasii]
MTRLAVNHRRRRSGSTRPTGWVDRTFPALPASSAQILLVAYLLQPVDKAPVDHLLNGDVG